MAMDGLDVVLVEYISDGGMGSHYHTLDKLLASPTPGWGPGRSAAS